MNSYTFAHPLFFLLLLLIPIFYFLNKKRNVTTSPSIKISDLQGLKKIQPSLKVRLMRFLPLLYVLGFVSLVIALARPQRALKEEEITAEGIDIMLVMDLSSSMLAKDFDPDRLEVSKQVAAEFIDKRRFDRIGLVVFSGEAFSQCPLTTDHVVLKELLSKLECGFLEDGTAIGMGLATGVNRIKESQAKSKVLILLTDGVNNAGYVSPLTAAQLAKEFNVKIYSVGVGSTGEAMTPVGKRSDGSYVFGLARVEIDEELLTQIAEMTGGRYFRATTEKDLIEIYNLIDKLEKTKIDVTAIKRKAEAFHPFAFFAIAMLFLAFLLNQTIFRKIP